MKLVLLAIITTALNASAVRWDRINDITNLRELRDIEYQVGSLPKSGRSHRRVWTSKDWFPLRKGGLARRNSSSRLSALSKLEIIDPLAVGANNWELRFASKYKNKWGGHCNGLAVAGIVEPEPVRSVRRRFNGRTVTFTPNDIKGLLMEVYQGPMPVVGDRCFKGKKRFRTDRYGRLRSRECQDLNPGTFHLALGNYLGRHGKPIIIDTHTHDVVWNWPAVSYSSKVTKVSERSAMRKIGVSNRSHYPFNGEATSFYSVYTKLKTANGKMHEYTYILEVNGSGNIIGGEWTGDSKKVHPDFFWRPDGVSIENIYLAGVVYTILGIAAESY